MGSEFGVAIECKTDFMIGKNFNMLQFTHWPADRLLALTGSFHFAVLNEAIGVAKKCFIDLHLVISRH